jgi:hypothetical protein
LYRYGWQADVTFVASMLVEKNQREFRVKRRVAKTHQPYRVDPTTEWMNRARQKNISFNQTTGQYPNIVLLVQSDREQQISLLLSIQNGTGSETIRFFFDW